MTDRLLHPPVPLCALVGMNEIHPVIINNMPKAKRLHLSSHQLHDSFPRPKEKAEIKDWDSFRPKGILKSNWVDKHRTHIPAVICLLYEWDQSKDWNTQTVTISAMVHNFRVRNNPRDFELVVVIIRHRNALGENESALEDKYRSMAKDSGVPARNIILVTTTDLKTSLKKLEAHLHSVACRNYREKYKRVKRLKDKVPRSVKSVQVRYHFKMGFYAELYNDQYLALSHYSSAYSYLNQMKVPTDSDRVIEVKAVAHVIVFKIIYLLLHMNRVSDGLVQFRHHINHYRNHVGIPSLAFHHYAWLSSQYQTFGEFWEEAPSAQRHSSKMQNSGYFYQSAAEYAVKRKELAQRALDVTGMGKLQPTGEIPTPEYLGQILTEAEQTLRNSSSSAYSGHEIQQHVIVQRILLQESKYDHSEGILVLLTQAYENFKKQRCSRMILHVASHMAAEYLSIGNHTMAKRFFDRIARTYRKESWDPILLGILLNALECARKLDMEKESVGYILDLLESFSLPIAERQRLAAIITDVAVTGACNIKDKLLKCPIVLVGSTSDLFEEGPLAISSLLPHQHPEAYVANLGSYLIP